MSTSQAPAGHPALFHYPAQARFGQVVPKQKIYAHSGANTRLKDLFVAQVEQIVWQYKLAPETLNLPARPGVTEIQVFRVVLKGPELSVEVLRCVDEAVPFPLVFELEYAQQVQMVAAYKRPSAAGTSRWVVGDYFWSGWRPAEAVRRELPVVLDLAGLYQALLQGLVPLSPRLQEGLPDWMARVELAARKHREVERVQARLMRERQFNRKVVLNATLRQLKAELEALSH